ncbi:TetR/AcrR family transcriptional regulator [Pyruvatibacter sp.]|uniref:TetR/AcrR family transcriptional regulator n=1 Tax=Pyruvatibacter sp. TaxID=1981328 RepID=UPI0032671CEF
MKKENDAKQPGLTRSERRKASTRARIVEAAERLMRDRGVEDVTIQDITEAADVGHGTFYLHFKTKGDVLRPLIQHLSDQVHVRVDQAAHGETDPALRMALGLRILLRAIAEDPLWSWYARSETSFSDLVSEMGTPPAQDMRNGLKSGRFEVADPAATTSFINGALVGMIASLDDGARPDDTADMTAELVLRVMGISAQEAHQIVRQPLETH